MTDEIDLSYFEIYPSRDGSKGGGNGGMHPPHQHENLRFLYGRFLTTRIILHTRILRSIDDNASYPPTKFSGAIPGPDPSKEYS